MSLLVSEVRLIEVSETELKQSMTVKKGYLAARDFGVDFAVSDLLLGLAEPLLLVRLEGCRQRLGLNILEVVDTVGQDHGILHGVDRSLS